MIFLLISLEWHMNWRPVRSLLIFCPRRWIERSWSERSPWQHTGGSFWCQGSAMSSDLFFACFSHPKYEPEYPELVFMKSWRVFGLMINGIICSGFRHCGIQGSSWPGEECDSECSIPRERLLQHRWSVSGPSSLGIRTEKISEETPGAVWNAWAESHVVSIELLKKKV